MQNTETAAQNLANNSSLSVGAALIQQFVNKLRCRNANCESIKAAEDFMKGIKFDDYEERSSCRLMQFSVCVAEEVIHRFCEENGWDDDSMRDLKFSASLLDADQKSDTFIRFQKLDDGEFFVHFIALKRVGEKLFFGLARHYVVFKLTSNVKVTESQRVYKTWWQRMKSTRKEPKSSATKQNEDPEQHTVTAEQAQLFENFFLLRALKKFAEDTPSSVHELPQEDKQFLTFGSDFDF